MLTLQRHQLVGHDILLARHGNHISTMRVDRQSGRVVAYLDDGSTDSAPNLISPGQHMPDAVRSILRDDWKFFAVMTAAPPASPAHSLLPPPLWPGSAATRAWRNC